jgi:hypothetical protein
MTELHQQVADLAVTYQKEPLSHMMGQLIQTQHELFTQLEDQKPPSTTKQLLVLASVTSGLLARVAHDRANPQAALAHSRTAFLCADNAGHCGMRAWIRGLQSLIAFWAGRHHDAVRYAQQGSTHGAVGTTSVWLPVSEARAWAALGNSQATLAAIRRAEAARDAVQPDEVDEFGGLCTFSRNRQLYYIADSLAQLPTEALSAERYSLKAVSAYSDQTAADWAFGDAAGSACGLAAARVSRGEILGADLALEPVFALPIDQRINGIVLSLNRVHRALALAPFSRESHQLQQRIEDFTATPLTSLRH